MAILVGLLGYLSSVFSLLIDLGHPERIVLPIIYWNAESPLFEVAWCVMLYMTVMVFEFTPAVFERFGLKRAEHLVHEFVIPLVIGGTVSLDPPSVLAWLAVPERPDQLDKLWYTPLLPLFFFMSAVYVGPAVVIVVATMASKRFSRKLDSDAAGGPGEGAARSCSASTSSRRSPSWRARASSASCSKARAAAPSFCWRSPSASSSRWSSSAFKGVRTEPSARFVASLMVVLGLMLNRVDVSIVAWARPQRCRVLRAARARIRLHRRASGPGLALVFYMCAQVPAACSVRRRTGRRRNRRWKNSQRGRAARKGRLFFRPLCTLETE